MLPTASVSILLFITHGLKIIDAGIWDENSNHNHRVHRRGFASPEHITALENKLSAIENSLETVNKVILGLQDKLTSLMEKRYLAPDLHEKFQAFDRKLDFLQRSHEEQESYSNKLTALEFTLNHVLSKVVYLSDNIQPRTENVDAQRSTATQPKPVDIEILARLNDLLRHVQSIKRDNCRRSSLPAAAGPVNKIHNLEKSNKSMQNGNNCKSENNTFNIDEVIKQLVNRLNPEVITGIRDLPAIMKRHDEQLDNVLGFVKKTDKRLENWSSEDLQQQNWQRMLQYCQDVSNEFSSFAGNSDALLKRIESFLRDIVYSNKRKNSSVACAGRKNVSYVYDGSTEGINSNGSTRAGFNYDYVDALPDKSGCHELTDSEYIDGIYRFGTPDVNSAGRDYNTRFCVFAATNDDERAWTVIQRRGPFVVQENFNRSWAEYRDGFGELNKDFWFGNEFIRRLTSNNNYELLIELENFDGGKMSIAYGSFGLDREHHNYSLFVGNYKGPGPDSLSYHNFMDFSTYDRNNNKNLDSCCACALGYGSGWWFDNCLEANLNGIYRFEPYNHSYVGIIWEQWLGDYSLKSSRMLVRPKNWTLLENADDVRRQWLEDP